MDMRIDELATRAGLPTRTIRYYTQQDLLPAPRLQGRVGWYEQRHLDRLRLIKELQEKRYLPLGVIRSVLRRMDAGADLEAMLAPLDMVFAPRWDDGSRATFDRAGLAMQAGVEPDVVDAAEEMGLLFPADGRFTTDDVQMVELARDWLKLGLPADLAQLYRQSLQQISRVQVRAFNAAVVAPVARRELAPDETRHELLEGYKEMSRLCNRLVGLLHRKLLQQAVETSYTEET